MRKNLATNFFNQTLIFIAIYFMLVHNSKFAHILSCHFQFSAPSVSETRTTLTRRKILYIHSITPRIGINSSYTTCTRGKIFTYEHQKAFNTVYIIRHISTQNVTRKQVDTFYIPIRFRCWLDSCAGLRTECSPEFSLDLTHHVRRLVRR